MLTSIFGRPFHFCTVGKSGVQLCFQLAQIFLLSGWRGRVTFSYRLAKISRLEASENLSHCSWLTDEVYKAFPRFQATRITTNLFMGYKRNQDKAKSLWAADQVNPNLPYQRKKTSEDWTCSHPEEYSSKLKCILHTHVVQRILPLVDMILQLHM
jgi:hypothetical protein